MSDIDNEEGVDILEDDWDGGADEPQKPVSDAESLSSSANEDEGDEEEEEDVVVTADVAPSENRVNWIVVPQSQWMSTDILSLAEKTECEGIRASQIELNNNCMVPIDGLDNPTRMAEREMDMRMTPLLIPRIVGQRWNRTTRQYDVFVEMRCPRDMQHPDGGRAQM